MIVGKYWVSGRYGDGRTPRVGPYSHKAARSVAKNVQGSKIHRSGHGKSNFPCLIIAIALVSALAALPVGAIWAVTALASAA